ncbi:MAG TPA: aminotransferase class V-fold PLP-dependent enzyme [Vicinamibacterales bacterium]|nr:aminotransferase class V-fold PLP-dependent enzyme [Vicinamibacterales bacterium]
MTFGRHLRDEWLLDPAIIYLNHPTVGATPRQVLAAQRAIQDEAERQPSRFMLRELTAIVVGRARPDRPRLRVAADAVGAFVGARGDDLVFVDNTTTGANAVLRGYPFEAGDEILVSDLGYGGVTLAAHFAARERGATVRTVAIPPPWRSEAVADAFEQAVGPRTRLAVVDHIAAEAAIVFPLADIAARLRRRGVAVLADGAHAPGSIPLDVPAQGVDWYTANLHKWAFVPRSSGFLWAAPERQATLHPAVISWGLDQGFTTEFDMVGTRDPSPHLAAPAAFAFIERLGGLAAIHAYTHDLCWQGAHLLAKRWGTTFDTPRAMIGAMASITLPPSLGSTSDDAATVRDGLLFDDGIEVAVHAAGGRLHMRVSAQVYNDLSDYETLAEAVARRARGA